MGLLQASRPIDGPDVTEVVQSRKYRPSPDSLRRPEGYTMRYSCNISGIVQRKLTLLAGLPYVLHIRGFSSVLTDLDWKQHVSDFNVP